jgi:hypothetical protein
MLQRRHEGPCPRQLQQLSQAGGEHVPRRPLGSNRAEHAAERQRGFIVVSLVGFVLGTDQLAPEEDQDKR